MFARASKRQCLARPPGELLARSFSNTAPARADFTHVVIGGGAIGLATARALALAQPSSSTLLLERHAQPGTETSSRNSEVIHAGLYYGAGSLKTRLCISGKEALYAFCAAHGVGHANTGKWIVAQDAAQREVLERTHAYCRDEIGVPTRWVGAAEAAREEPSVRARAGVLASPTTGVVDSHGLMVALQGQFEDAGGTTALNSRVDAIEPLPGSSNDKPGSGGWRLTVADSNSSTGSSSSTSTITTETLINSAGLGAVAVHNMIAPPADQRQMFYAKGNYFSYGASSPKTKRLIYPVTAPGAGGLGTHLTLDLAGRLRFGPDVEWVDSPDDLSVNTARFARALDEIRAYLPDVDEKALAPDYAGIRPKLARAGAVGSGKGFVDFYIRREEAFEGWVNLLGMESPGLTSCLAIGDYVRDLLYGSQKVD
ncbi:Uu.00g009990.m01.CDS01 [Anthostomella pinea]|uniref:L-2-hydroxyglutarate dehydrogenase, mitochondrial n=1 Tax=Anthostomella pinea TaxID=933095 RepID=A0AAI8VY40_9PEZI|nr:Uu.00g009990.m01.CDS01 [Anthostomella pinea]